MASGFVCPTPATLKKYGLTAKDWQKILAAQGNMCGACGSVPTTKRLNIDHEHVRGWKKMEPERRKEYVRGLLCLLCNRYRLGKGATVENLRGAADYLQRYESRKIQ